jgi:hypothetical protein
MARRSPAVGLSNTLIGVFCNNYVWLLNHFLELSLAKREKREFLLISPRLLEVLSLHCLFISKCFGGRHPRKISLCTAGPFAHDMDFF